MRCTTSTIATQGYQGTDMAFFPLFPLLINILGSLAGNHLVAGLLISNASFFFGLLYLYKLLEHEYDRSVARRAIFYVSIFPSAVFFSAVYTESLFFMLTVASFYYMRSHRWWLAGAIGLFAAMTRVEGVLLVVPFLIEWFAQYKPRLSALIRQLIPGGLIPLGLSIYMAYLWVLAPIRSTFRTCRFTGTATSRRRGSASSTPSTRSRRPRRADDRQQAIELAFTALDDRRADRRLEAVAPLVHRLHGALDPGADVHLEPDEHAALRARALPDVRDPRALRREARGSTTSSLPSRCRSWDSSPCSLQIGIGLRDA